jgi:transcriptional regulator with XRE-family HTH domain
MTVDMLPNALADLEKRRRDLGMSEEFLAKRAGVSRNTVRRILSGESANVSLGSVVAVAEALGVDVRFEKEAPETCLERQAEKKARQLVGMVQGNMGLESQAVGEDVVNQMIRDTVHRLLAGSKRNLWGD